MARNSNKRNEYKTSSKYKGPYQPNKNFEFDCVKKSMRTPTDGPTADMRSYNDSTISQSSKDGSIKLKKRPRPFDRKAKSWFREYWKECLIGILLTAVSAWIGIIVYDHSIQIVSINKDIEYMKGFDDECKNDIDKLEDIVKDNKTNIKLNQQRIDDIRVIKQNIKK